MRAFILFFVLFSSLAQARVWKKIEIPGAKCGNGGAYAVFFEKRSATKLAIELMGGGACWNFQTCYLLRPRAWVFPVGAPLEGQFSSMDSIASQHSYLYLPYCTGDVHVGRHVAPYGPTYHQGNENVLRTLSYLQTKGIIPFQQVEDLILYGASAGGIGALAHAQDVDQYLPANARRTLIADSPGLHYGKNFWEKFGGPMIRDITDAFTRLDVVIDPQDGNVGKQIPQVCKALRHWNIGLLQGSRDVVMSWLFGEIGPEEHERLVYSQEGIFQNTLRTANCRAWVPATGMHTFLIARTAGQVHPQGVSGMQFAAQIYAGKLGINYR